MCIRDRIISINFENLDYEPLKDYMKLYNYLKERLCADKMTYIFLDEVQEVQSFEKVVDSLYIRDYVDVYICLLYTSCRQMWQRG